MTKLYMTGCISIEEEDHSKIKLEYYIIEEIRNAEGLAPLYGVGIRKLKKKTEGMQKEQEFAKAISYSRGYVEKLAILLEENTVTPMNLYEIVDDYVSREGVSA